MSIKPNYQDIVDKVLLHESAYLALNKSVPAYRITRAELKLIWNHLIKHNPDLCKETHYDGASYFFGVELEIVTIG